MASRNQIKQWFKTFDKPLSSQFWEWLNSYWHKDDQIPIESIDGLTQVLQQKANKSDVDVKAAKNSTEAFACGDLMIKTDRINNSITVCDKTTDTVLFEVNKYGQINSYGTPNISPHASGAVNTYRNGKLRVQQTTVGGHFQINMWNDNDDLMCCINTNGETFFKGGNVNIYGKKLTGIADAEDNTDAVNRQFLDLEINKLLNQYPANSPNFLTLLFNPEFDNGNSGATKTIDWANGQNQKLKLTGNCTITLPIIVGTGRFQIKFIQDSVGGRSVSFSGQTVKNPSSFDFSTGTANQECIATFYWDGEKYIVLSTLYYS